jgi:hypothetical protein
MRTISAQLIFLVLSFLRLVQTPQPSTPALHETDTTRLQLTVRTDKQTYSIKDKMLMEVQLTNVGQDTVYVYRWDLCWGRGLALNMRVKDSQGRDVYTAILWDCIPPPPKPDEPSEFIRIEPSNFYGLRDEIKMREIVNRPGEYQLIIQFGSSLSTEFLKDAGFPKLPYWTTPDKPLRKSIHITVSP